MLRVFTTFLLCALVGLTACDRDTFDPYDEVEQPFALANFDRLQLGSAFRITVRPGTAFAVVARGDRDDIGDLNVTVRNGELRAEYRNNLRVRRHEMRFTITMPTLRATTFSGAARADVAGFTNLPALDVRLAGASQGEFNVQAAQTTIDLSGASELTMTGNANALRADASGASRLRLFAYPVATATLDVSGASRADVTVSTALEVNATGASNVRYRGNPTVQQRVTGGSSVQRE